MRCETERVGGRRIDNDLYPANIGRSEYLEASQVLEDTSGRSSYERVVDGKLVIVAMNEQHGKCRSLDLVFQYLQKRLERLPIVIIDRRGEVGIGVHRYHDCPGVRGLGKCKRGSQPRGGRSGTSIRFDVTKTGAAGEVSQSVLRSDEMDRGKNDSRIRPPYVLDELGPTRVGRLGGQGNAGPSKAPGWIAEKDLAQPSQPFQRIMRTGNPFVTISPLVVARSVDERMALALERG